jgi:acyl-CoA synthetase
VCVGLRRCGRQINLGAPLFAPLCLVDADALAVVGAQDGVLHGVSTASGATVWRHQVGAAITAAPGIALSEDGEHEQSTLCCLCGCNGEVVVVKLPNGQLQGSSTVQEVARTRLAGDVFSSPVMVRNRAYVGCRDDHLYCLELRREQPLATEPPTQRAPSCDEYRQNSS